MEALWCEGAASSATAIHGVFSWSKKSIYPVNEKTNSHPTVKKSL